MDELVIEVERRSSTGTSETRKLRRAGLVPAVVYGGGKEAVPVTVDRHAVTELLRSEKGRNTVFLLKMKGTKQERHALILDEQRNPLTGQLTHLDFIRVMKGQRVKVDIPIELVGESVGVKAGGFLDFVTRNLHVECEADAIPEMFHVDVADLDLGDHFTVDQLQLPDGVKLLDAPHTIVVTIEKHGLKGGEEEEEAAAEAALAGEAATEPEVIRRGKAEEDETES